jgi:hypothetical protein
MTKKHCFPAFCAGSGFARGCAATNGIGEYLGFGSHYKSSEFTLSAIRYTLFAIRYTSKYLPTGKHAGILTHYQTKIN